MHSLQIRTHLRWIVQIPIICPHCFKVSLDHLAKLTKHDELPCAHCGKPINLTSQKWRAYINQFEVALASIDADYGELFFPPSSPRADC